MGEAIVGTAGNDTVSAVMGDATGATGTSTLNLADTIDGGAGTDTFNLILAGAAAGALPTGVVIKNVEKINLIHTNDAITIGAAATAATTSSTYAGIAELWQTDNDSVAAGSFGDVSVAQGVAAGFASTGKSASAVAVTTAVAIDSTAAATSATVVVDGVATASDLNIGGAAVKTVTVKGSVALANDVTGTNGTLNIDVDGTIAETLNVGLTSKTTVTFTPTAGDTLKTLDMSSSTGNLTSTVSNTAETSLTSVKGSQGNDTMNLTFGNKALVVDLGAGADSITLTGTVGANVLPTVTLGAGKDTVVVDQLALVNLGAGIDTDANLTARMITVTDFNKAEDVINLAGTGVALTAPQLDTIKAATTLVSAATQAAALAGGVGGQVVFSWGSDAYVYTDVAAPGLSVGDSLVKIVGVDAAELSTGQNGNLVL